jgi:ATP-binding cassette subfamily C protein CydCD
MHRRLLSLTRDNRLVLIITILSGLLVGILTIWQAYVLSKIVSSVFLSGATLDTGRNSLRLLLIVISLRAAFSWISEVSASTISIHVRNHLRQRLITHILLLGPAYTRGERTGELTSTVMEGVEALDAYFSQYLPQLILAVLVPIMILVFVFPRDPLSALVLLLTAPLIPVFIYLIGKAAESLTKRQWETMSRLSAHFLDSLQGLATLKLFGQSKAHATTIEETSNHFRDITLTVLRITFLSALVLEMVATLSTAVVAVEVGLRLLYFKMTFEQAFFLLILAPEFYLPLRLLGLRFHAGMAGTSAARRIFDVLDTPLEDNQATSTSNLIKSAIPSLPGDRITFTNVSFNFSPDGPPALQNVNMTIHVDEHIALVGTSGSGKSTFAHLLLRFIEPSGGQIDVDNCLLNEISAETWREQIAWVPQQPYFFHDTILANICLAQPTAGLEAVISAAKAANLHEFILSLPARYETLIGEGGARLSNGEAQRLALARAFLKNAPILLLDEPTSSLDPENESLIDEAIRHLMQGRTVITIAHRLNTVFKADRIIVFQNGRIVESGKHIELLVYGGLYADLVQTQSAGFNKIIKNKRTIKFLNLPGTANSTPFHKPDTISYETCAKSSGNLSRLLGYLHGSLSWVALSVLLGILTIGSNIALMGTSAWLISSAALHPSIADLQLAIVGVRFFGIARGIFRYLERLVSHNVTFRLLARFRVWFYQHIEPLAPALLMQYRSGDLLSRIVADVETLGDFYVRVVAPPLVAIFVSLGTAAFLAQYHISLGLMILALFACLGMSLPSLTHFASRNTGRELIERRTILSTQLVDTIQGLADLVAYGRVTDQLKNISAAGSALSRIQQRMSWLVSFITSLNILLTNLGMWLILVVAIPLTSAKLIPGVMLAVLCLVTLAAFEAVIPLPVAASLLSSTSEAARRLFAALDAPPTVTDPPHSLLGPSNVSLDIRDLHFRYDPDDPPALSGIDLNLPEGGNLAIVGPSGAGKSTLVNLLLRFYDYHDGQIMLGGHDLRHYAQDDIRQQISLVSQNTYFFNATICDNMCLARPDATDDELVRAAKQAHIHEFISTLPKGYETFIGEKGLRLSGGERQRLAIARALLKSAPLLILDEPTANLDAITERQVLETLFGLMEGRSTLLITHRLVGLERFSQIIVLDHGKIIERGRHAELLAVDSLYRRLWDFQNRILTE